jgi:cellobiose phosphorylase
MYQAGTKWILGIRPSYDGLLIDPCIPHTWNEFSVQRTFRNAIYSIHISNPNHVNKGIQYVYIDGEKFESNLLPIFKEGKHIVEIVMG